ncbi:MAG: hypothetical protein D6696_10135 [Acidobacteria bacterium]|nr:MAG: hypothetical protein D6696_10135 [Acidobacteriota bacterium]
MSNRGRLPLLLLAFALALAVKIAVYEGGQLSERTIEVGVVIQPPPGFRVLHPINKVEVRLQGKSSDVAILNPQNASVLVPIEASTPGAYPVTIRPENVRLPPGNFEVLSIEPSSLSLEIDREVSKIVSLEVQPVGEPAAGATVREIEVRPSEVEVVGPEKLLRNLDSLPVVVSVERRAFSFEERTVPEMPPLVRLANPIQVVVSVRLEEPQLNVDLDEVGGGGAEE